MNGLCDVVVLTWNQLAVIKSFVDSFIGNTAVPCRLIIIDNGSVDGTADYLSSLKDTSLCRFKVILNKDNKGFVGGMNQGIAAARAPYVCLTNNDLIFTNGWLSQQISLFERNSNIGVLNPNSNSLGVTHPRGVTLDSFARNLEDKYKDVFVEMPFCLGFCLTIRREVIDKVGGLSEEFYPMFFEDTDFSRKAIAAGYLVGVAKAAYVWHKEHASFKQMGDRKERAFVNSRETFIKKWGKILRVAWVVNSYQEVLDNLGAGINLARQGNFVRFFVKNLTAEREDIFKQGNFFEHAEVQFLRFSNIFDLTWKILKKKKRYDAVISKDKFIKGIFVKFKYNVLTEFNPSKIKEIKSQGQALRLSVINNQRGL